jgi:hypothetical protein
MLDQAPTISEDDAQSRVATDDDDESYDNVIAVPRNRDCDHHMSSLVAEIEDAPYTDCRDQSYPAAGNRSDHTDSVPAIRSPD